MLVQWSIALMGSCVTVVALTWWVMHCLTEDISTLLRYAPSIFAYGGAGLILLLGVSCMAYLMSR